MLTAAPATIQDFLWSGDVFRLSEKGTACYVGQRNPSNLWPKRADEQYINCVLIHNIKPRRAGRWHGQEYRVTKLLPLTTPAWPA